MIISNSRKFIFVHLHKTAGSALKLALEPHLAWNDLVLGGTPGAEIIAPVYEDRFKLSKHSTISEIAQACGAEILDSHVSFSIVREPIMRTLSLYNYLADLIRVEGFTMGLTHDEMVDAARAEDPAFAHHILEWPACRAYYTQSSFSDFIRSEELDGDIGFRPQLRALQSSDGKIMVDRLFRYEHLLRDLPKIWDTVGCRVMLPVWNRPKTYRMSYSDISEDDRAFLRKRFADDYLALDYD